MCYAYTDAVPLEKFIVCDAASADAGAEPNTSPPTPVNSKESADKPVISLTDSASKPVSPTLVKKEPHLSPPHSWGRDPSL